jgi:transposase
VIESGECPVILSKMAEYVGIDLHRRRSVIYRMDENGERIDCTRVDNDPMRFAEEVSVAPIGSDVVIEATYGWYWAVDLLQDMGYRVHLANPHGNDWGHRRVKNDERDAKDLADLLRLGRLAEAWIAPPKTRELRELVRFRMKLSNIRTGVKAQVHSVMAKNGVLPSRGDMWGPGGAAQFNALKIPRAYEDRIEVLRDLVAVLDGEIFWLDREIHEALRDDLGYIAIQAIYGVGEVLAGIFVAEIGDVTRFPTAKSLCSWAGLTPLHRESDTKVHRGRISKQGSKLVRWAAVEAVARYHGGAHLRESFTVIAERRGNNRATVAVARKVLTLVYYGLRDGEIRCLRDRDAL